MIAFSFLNGFGLSSQQRLVQLKVVRLYEAPIDNCLIPSLHGDCVPENNMAMLNFERVAIPDDGHVPDNQHIDLVHGDLCAYFLRDCNDSVKKRYAEDAHAVPNQPLIMSSNVEK